MTRRWWLFATLGLVLAVLAVPTAQLMTAGPAADVPAATATTERVASPSASDLVGAAEEVGDFLWWRLGWRRLGDDGPPDFGTLTIGRMGGETLGQVKVGRGAFVGAGAGPPFVIGPSDGLILYAMRRGDANELHLVDADAERDDVLVRTPALLHHAALAARSGFAYFATGPGQPGIWRVRLDGSAAAELVADPPELAGAGIVLAAPIEAFPKQVTLRLDADEKHLASLACTRSCTLRVIELASGAETVVEGLDPTVREITDFVAGRVVISTRAIDAATGDVALLPEGANDRVDVEKGWELPPGWRLEERAMDPNAQLVGLTWFVLLGPNGQQIPVEAMGQGTGQG